MLTRQEVPSRPRILYSCYTNHSREGEQFVPEHVFSYQLAGTLLLDEGSQTYALTPGTFRFLRRNRLVKFQKQLPAAGGEFRSVSVSFGQDMLRAIAQEYGYSASHQQPSAAVLPLPDHPLYQSYLASLRPYEQLAQPDHAALLALKVREAVLYCCKSTPSCAMYCLTSASPAKST